MDAFNSLVTQYQDLVFLTAFWTLGKPEPAEAVTQQTFLSAYRQLPRFRGGDFRCWLLKIARCQCHEILMGRRLWNSFSKVPADSAHPGIGQVGASPAAEAEMDSLPANVLGLAADVRAVVVLVDLHGLNYRQAAEILEIPVREVRTRLASGRRQIGGLFAGDKS